MRPHVYSSADDNAPQVFMKAGDINAAIKACLVTGYGTKAPSGWELLAEDLGGRTLTVRSKNPKSALSVFVVDDSDIQRGPSITGYLGWSDSESTPVQKYGVRYGSYNRNVESRPTANAQTWIIIASDSCVYFYLGSNDQGGYGTLQGFGDCLSADSIASASYVMGYTDSRYQDSTTAITTVASSDGTLHFALAPFNQTYPGSLGDGGSITNPTVSNGIYILNRIVLYKETVAGKQPAYFLPGLMRAAAQFESIVLPANKLRQVQVSGEIVAFFVQKTHGYIPILLDDWGVI